MAKKKQKKTNNAFGTFVLIIVLPVLLINIWAGWKILNLADVLQIPLIGSVDDGPRQVAALLFINCGVVALLAMTKRK